MLTDNDSLIRLSIFIAVLFLFALLEAAFPRKDRTQPRLWRWLTNLGLVFINGLTIKLMGQVTAMAAAALAVANGWGLFSWLELPFAVEVLLAVILLDGAVYAQHVASHKIPILWRLHRVHHADRDIDVTTGSRFHPVEICLSMLYKCLVIFALGPAVLAVFIFEIVLNASAMFNHSNLRIPLAMDNWVRQLFVTPDMHRVHHSVYQNETDSNYGFCLSIWDRLFSTYTPQPKDGHLQMKIGLSDYQTPKPSNLWWCLGFPFKKNN